MKKLILTLAIVSSFSTLAVGEMATDDCARTMANLDSRVASSEAKNSSPDAVKPKTEAKSSSEVRD
ncbi:hypothetical protein M899_0188 [Bacteriovorax sp. BSW11_IV]|uniref:hypothetical protein n=1 Tax=Bacteriovorax sp. BSW11_IV TaxID=1353529 RepID=UPI000389E0C4|nr:hypothetical protein [Bacteriovorax sp. BSW11_IV]EQC47002.1 hypothetical protein M899_0188 [Bacteriovorax sp. BSW11_IV]